MKPWPANNAVKLPAAANTLTWTRGVVVAAAASYGDRYAREKERLSHA